MINDRSLKNIVPWQPGQSGNPAGRPKNTPLVTPALRRFAMMPAVEIVALLADEEAKSKLTLAEALALVILEKALKEKAWGDATRELVLNRIDGPLKMGDVNIGEGSVVQIIRNNVPELNV